MILARFLICFEQIFLDFLLLSTLSGRSEDALWTPSGRSAGALWTLNDPLFMLARRGWICTLVLPAELYLYFVDPGKMAKRGYSLRNCTPVLLKSEVEEMLVVLYPLFSRISLTCGLFSLKRRGTDPPHENRGTGPPT